MKVIFLRDHLSVARKDSIKKVANGFARNFLIPQKIATPATKGALNKLTQDKKKTEEDKKHLIENAKIATEKLVGQTLILKRKSTEGGKLFAAIAAKEIIEEIIKKFSTKIKESNLSKFIPIKNIGEYQIFLNFIDDVAGSLKLVINAE